MERLDLCLAQGVFRPVTLLRVTLKVDHGLGVVMQCGCRFIGCDKVPALLTTGAAVHVWAQGYMGNLWTFCSILL